MATYSDDFNRPDESLGTSDDWVVDYGNDDAQIVSNQAVLTGASDGYRNYRYTGASSITYPYTVKATVTQTSTTGRVGPVGVNCLVGGSGYFPMIEKDENRWAILRRNGGSSFSLIEASFDDFPEPAVPYDISLTVDIETEDGNDYPVLTLIAGGVTIIDSERDEWGDRVTSGEPGMLWDDGDTTFAIDNFIVEDAQSSVSSLSLSTSFVSAANNVHVDMVLPGGGSIYSLARLHSETAPTEAELLATTELAVGNSDAPTFAGITISNAQAGIFNIYVLFVPLSGGANILDSATEYFPRQNYLLTRLTSVGLGNAIPANPALTDQYLNDNKVYVEYGNLSGLDNVTVLANSLLEWTETTLEISGSFDYRFIEMSDTPSIGAEATLITPAEIYAGEGVAPVLPADIAINVAENQTTVGTFTATAGTAPITYTLGGPDAALFNLSTSGEITFIEAPDFETPKDADEGNHYELILTASNDSGQDTQAITVNVTDVDDLPDDVELMAILPTVDCLVDLAEASVAKTDAKVFCEVALPGMQAGLVIPAANAALSALESTFEIALPSLELDLELPKASASLLAVESVFEIALPSLNITLAIPDINATPLKIDSVVEVSLPVLEIGLTASDTSTLITSNAADLISEIIFPSIHAEIITPQASLAYSQVKQADQAMLPEANGEIAIAELFFTHIEASDSFPSININHIQVTIL